VWGRADPLWATLPTEVTVLEQRAIRVDERAHIVIALHRLEQVIAVPEVQHHDGHVVLPAEREGGHVHHLELTA